MRWTGERVLGVAGVTVLLLVGLISLLMLLGEIGGNGGEREVREESGAQATATPTPTPTPTVEPKPTPAPLTAEQRAAREAAVTLVQGKGFDVVRRRDYDPRRTLRVLIGRQTGGKGHLAFFFVGERYIGNDTSEPSGPIAVRGQRDRQVTLRYTLAGDDSAGVRFRWDGASLEPLDLIPAAEKRAPVP